MVPRNIKQKQDGKIKTEDFLYEYYKNLKQKLAYKPGFTNHEFRSWQDAVREKLKEMMKFPEEGNLSGQSDMMWQKEYGSYFIEKHIIYPEPYSALPFLVMIPKFASEEKNILSYLIVQ